ncbi:MAG TPA: polysaccharide biosynthesis/export family protein [Candidatus Limnocylindria bacterium]|nr:polysaccharide biosynthesis/export family protein [Candidatus Limnocylindria bacterium]
MSGRIITIAAIAAALTLDVTAALAQAPAQPAPAASPSSGPLPGEQQGTLPAGDYRIGPEDLLHIIVWKNDPMSRIVLVRPDGHISLPLLNDVKAAGLTPMQLRDTLVKSLAEYMPSPEVSVIVNDIRSFKVSVIGEVIRPGRYELKSATTALDVLAAAGGFSSFANRTKIVVLRPTSTTIGDAASMKRIPFNYNRVISSGGEQENIYLQPGDIVLVP